jgi:hypothetical protein
MINCDRHRSWTAAGCQHCWIERALRERDEAIECLLSLKDELTLRDERDHAIRERDEARDWARAFWRDAKPEYNGHNSRAVLREVPWLEGME